MKKQAHISRADDLGEKYIGQGKTVGGVCGKLLLRTKTEMTLDRGRS
jgi:hypothetical protein